MTNTTTAKAEVIKKGNTYHFMMGDETLARLGVMTFTFRNKLTKDLKKMKWYLPKEDFKPSGIEVPKSGDVKGTERFRAERDSLAMWSPVLAYMKADDKEDMAKRICGEFLGMEDVPKPFTSKFTEILEDFSSVLTKFITNADSN